MHVQTSGVENLAVRMLKWTLLLAIFSNLAMGQATTAATPDSVPKAAPAASVDNPPKSVPGVRPDSYIIGAEDVITVYVWKEPDMSKTIPVQA